MACLWLELYTANALLNDLGMVSCAAQTILKSWFSRFRGSRLLRLVGLPTALLALYLEVYGSSPAAASLILHRLARRVCLSTILCTLKKGHDMSNSDSILDLGHVDSMDGAQTPTLHDKGVDPSSQTKTSDASISNVLPSPSPSPAMPSHSRSRTVDVVRQGKRLSLQFPIQPATRSTSPTSSTRSRPQSWYNGGNHVTALEPLNTALANSPPTQYDDDGSNLWMQKEMERRKSLLSHTRTTQRKVFSGSRHLRTLSLLSPDRTDSPALLQPLDLQDQQSPSSRPQLSARSTSADITRQVVTAGDHDRYEMGGMPTIQREQLIRAGTQMATDFKKGLFTFIEDIRQATVGDEAVNHADGIAGGPSAKGLSKHNRKTSDVRPPLTRSASSKKTQPLGSVGDDFWKEMGLSEPKTNAVNKKTHALKNTSTPQKQIRKMASEEEWDNWDTPSESRDNANESLLLDLADSKDSSDDSDAPTSPVSGPASSRTSISTRYHSRRHDSKASSLTSINQDDITPREVKRSSIPWPDMTKVSPSNLKRTASHLMREWEKQLTPPPESRGQDYSHGDYMN
ncbi:conserved hypothetical protein [Pyrenophora tritici-repentis Pt-1C-BFP]|uniref:DUF4048 domain-containing protein n=1 Tax=Pyrenophora tritici-repentis (strain Pt-1C-BFP) TaxID=426418 RepID=B2WLT8_PYRTR|nr:uncharacterized protein PTRG_10948 [Pyrenophora tritici-repentis Pt-1C-BFP]EDU43998.1 conserved hypothetical protein [Pyrenophora tritici-repentis Pt-1C-BFP]